MTNYKITFRTHAHNRHFTHDNYFYLAASCGNKIFHNIHQSSPCGPCLMW